jgi:hypothetical protein
MDKMNAQKNWFSRWWSKDSRKAERLQQPKLVAHYWTGAPPAARGIRDISSTGLYLVTQERWYPGTLLKITLQTTDVTTDILEPSIAVLATVIRCGADGVGLAFVLPEKPDPRAEASSQDAVRERKAVDRFLDQLRTNMAEVHIDVE